MSIYDRIRELAHPVAAAPEATSYFSAPEAELDPRLFSGDRLKPSVRQRLLSTIHNFLSQRYAHVDTWLRVYLAGSGVSYQWSAARQPGDLDVLLGVDFVGFRRSNPSFRDLGDVEIASHLNQQLRDGLWPHTADWNGFEVTWYCNPGGYDIRDLNPYAAFDLTRDEWVVRPNPQPHPPAEPEWDVIVNGDTADATQILARYNKALDETIGVLNPGARLNASITLRAAAREGAALFDEIHEGRKKAFGASGAGYDDLAEYRYKAAKGSGVMKAMRTLKEQLEEAGVAEDEDLYGTRLTSPRDILVAAAVDRRYRG